MSIITTPGGEGKLADNPMQPETGEPHQLRNAPRCQARTRSGKSCRCPVVHGRKRCRMHGGTNAGAPKGERNGMWKHGGETREAVALRRQATALIRELASA